jgi:hypothetical protein
MTAPRSQFVDSEAPGFYHCVSRCVRRAFLCGTDSYTGRSFEHRKAWVEDRLLELADVFAVGVYAFAVMSNHVHVVAYLTPATARSWSPEEVAQRWTRLCPSHRQGEVDVEANRIRTEAMAGNAERIAICRERLASLSWFMRCLSEPIARRANREDACTGRFWEGRFRCQALLDDAALVACMAYVDLNPIRAGLAADLPASEHTPVQRRLQTIDGTLDADTPLVPMRGPPAPSMPLGLRDYMQLVDFTGRIARPDKRGAIDLQAAPILRRLHLDADQWRGQALGIETRYWRAVGAVDALLAKARDLGQCWLKGVGEARGRSVVALR